MDRIRRALAKVYSDIIRVRQKDVERIEGVLKMLTDYLSSSVNKVGTFHHRVFEVAVKCLAPLQLPVEGMGMLKSTIEVVNNIHAAAVKNMNKALHKHGLLSAASVSADHVVCPHIVCQSPRWESSLTTTSLFSLTPPKRPSEIPTSPSF